MPGHAGLCCLAGCLCLDGVHLNCRGYDGIHAPTHILLLVTAITPPPQIHTHTSNTTTTTTTTIREREGDLAGMLAGLKDGTYAALVLDAPVVEYVVGTNDACTLFVVGDAFESFSLALAFVPGFSDSTVFDFSRAIVKLQACLSVGWLVGWLAQG